MLKTAQSRKLSFFQIIAIVGLAAVLIGFGKTFIIPVSNNSFQAPAVIYIHGAFAFSWIALFFSQSFLIHRRNYKLHINLGKLAIFVAAGVAITIIPAGLFEVEKSLARGSGEAAYSVIVGSITSAILFFSLVVAGIMKRKKPAVHKRFMFLATVVVLWPAWFRFRHYFPSVPKPEVWFGLVLADSLIVAGWLWEYLKYKKIHWVMGWVGLAVIIEQSLEVYFFDNPTWRIVGKQVYLFLNQTI